jgi:hypothetical protein
LEKRLGVVLNMEVKGGNFWYPEKRDAEKRWKLHESTRDLLLDLTFLQLFGATWGIVDTFHFQYPVRYVLADTEVIAQSNSIQANQQNLPKSRMVTGASTKQEAAAPDQNVHGYAKPWYHGFSGNNCCKKWMFSPPVHTIHT